MDPVPPQFTNPWTQGQMNDAAANLHALAKPPTIRTTGVSSPFMGGNTTALASNNMRNLSPPGQYSNSSGLMPNVGGHPAFTTAEMSMPGSTAPSPTTSGATFMPSFSSSFDITVPPRSHAPDRRLSQPSLSSSLYLGADMLPKQRQASLTDMAFRPRPDIDFNNDALDSARGMVVMSQTHPRSRQDSTHSAFASNHSASSSISSNHSFPYYNGGSVDSSATDYSETTGYPSDQTGILRQPTLPRPNGYIAGGATVPNQMMTTFSSKISSSTQKKHKCKVCDKRFTRPSSLQTHTYSHTGEKPFVCEHQGCGRRFSVVSNLRRHKKVHQGKSHGT